MHGMRKNKNNLKSIKKASFENDIDFSSLRWTLDEEKDLEFMNSIFLNLKNNVGWKEILSFVIDKPLLQLKNSIIPTNEGAINKSEKSYNRYRNSNNFFDQYE